MKCETVKAADIAVFTLNDGRKFVICGNCQKEAYYVGEAAECDRYFCENCRAWRVRVA